MDDEIIRFATEKEKLTNKCCLKCLFMEEMITYFKFEYCRCTKSFAWMTGIWSRYDQVCDKFKKVY